MLLTSRALSIVEMRIVQMWIPQQIKQCTTNAKCLNLEVGILVWVGEVGSRKKREADGMWRSPRICVFANCTVKLKGLVQSTSTNFETAVSTPRYRLIPPSDTTNPVSKDYCTSVHSSPCMSLKTFLLKIKMAIQYNSWGSASLLLQQSFKLLHRFSSVQSSCPNPTAGQIRRYVYELWVVYDTVP